MFAIFTVDVLRDVWPNSIEEECLCVIAWKVIIMLKIIILVCLVVKNVKGVSWNKIFVLFATKNFI
jgi:hypothetical protein